MSMPGFTGTASLYRTSGHYTQSAAGLAGAGSPAMVRAAQFEPPAASCTGDNGGTCNCPCGCTANETCSCKKCGGKRLPPISR